MLSFNEVNSWFETHIKGASSILSVSPAAVDEALALYDKQSDEFNDEAKRVMNEFSSHEFMSVLGKMKLTTHNPKAETRIENGNGCVLLSSRPLENIFRIYVSLTVPGFYHLLVTLQIDRNKKIIDGGITMNTFYTGHTVKPQKLITSNSGGTFDKILDYKSKVDNNQQIEEPHPGRYEGKLKFEYGKGLVKDES